MLIARRLGYSSSRPFARSLARSRDDGWETRFRARARRSGRLTSSGSNLLRERSRENFVPPRNWFVSTSEGKERGWKKKQSERNRRREVRRRGTRWGHVRSATCPIKWETHVSRNNEAIRISNASNFAVNARIYLIEAAATCTVRRRHDVTLFHRRAITTVGRSAVITRTMCYVIFLLFNSLLPLGRYINFHCFV